MKKIIGAAVTLLAITVSAHEFWLEPEKFFYKKSESANLRFLVGENFEGTNWTGNRARIQSLQYYWGDSIKDISGVLSERAGDSLSLRLDHEGTVMVTFNSKNSYIRLEPDKFNEYLNEDGLTEAITYRREHGETDSVGREFYQRSVKSILQVGSKMDDMVSRPTRLPLDIVPLQNPFKLKDGDTLRVRILFQNKVLANHKIRYWKKVDHRLVSPIVQSDNNGEITLPIAREGRWMISCVKMIHVENNPEAQWQSYWGSLTWGYDKK